MTLLALAVASASLCAQTIKVPDAGPRATRLSGRLASGSGTGMGSGNLLDYLLTPDGRRVLYRADQVTAGVHELFSVPADGSRSPIRLNDPLGPGQRIGGTSPYIGGPVGEADYATASGSSRVVYVADDAANVDELFSVPVDRSAAPIRLSSPGNPVSRFWLTQDGQYAILEDESGLKRARTDGGAPANPITSASAYEVWLSPDGTTIVYSVPVAGGRLSLFRVPTDGSAPPAFFFETDPFAAGATFVAELAFSDDVTHVVFVQVQQVDDGLFGAHLTTASLDGSSPPQRLNTRKLDGYLHPWVYDGDDRVAFYDRPGPWLVTTTLDGSQRALIQPAGWDTEASLLSLTPDDSKVLFAASQAGQFGFFQAPLDGSQAPVQLASAGVTSWQVAGSTVLFSTPWVEPVTFATYASLHSVPLAGGQAPVPLNPAPFHEASRYSLHSSGQDVLFRLTNAAGDLDLYTVPLDGSTLPRRLLAPPVAIGHAVRHSTAGSGQYVASLGDVDGDDTLELFGVPFDGGPAFPYNQPPADAPVVGDVHSFLVSADEERVLYRADQDLDEVIDLYATRTDGNSVPIRLTNGLPTNDVLAGVALSPGGTRAAFLHASPGSTTGKLHSVATTQPSAALLLDGRSGLVQQELLASSSRVVYRRRITPATFTLCSARLDGVGAALDLTGASRSLSGIQLSTDGGMAFYLAEQHAIGVVELHHVPVDGSAPAARLNPALGGHSDVSGFQLVPGGLRVAYLADAVTNDQFELYVVPSDGSAPAQKISAPLVAGGSVADFALSLDGAHVVYRADQRFDGTPELFRVPIGGGAATLITPLGSGIGVQPGYVLSVDGGTVYYRATQPGPQVLQLYGVAADGSASPVQLSGTMTAGGNVHAFELAPDQVHLVYRADQRVDTVMELFRTTATPGTAVLVHAQPPGTDVHSFRIAPDSRAVIYCIARRERLPPPTGGVRHAPRPPPDLTLELFEAPLDGGSAPVLLSPLPAGGDVEADYVPLSSGTTLYRADQERNDAVELYAVRHGPRTETPTGGMR